MFFIYLLNNEIVYENNFIDPTVEHDKLVYVTNAGAYTYTQSGLVSFDLATIGRSYVYNISEEEKQLFFEVSVVETEYFIQTTKIDLLYAMNLAPGQERADRMAVLQQQIQTYEARLNVYKDLLVLGNT